MNQDEQHDRIVCEAIVAQNLWELTSTCPENEMYEPWGGLFHSPAYPVYFIAHC